MSVLALSLSWFFLACVAVETSLPTARIAGSTWRDDRVWYDGLAEKCVYQATRTIYGEPRSYEAIAYTNKENVDPVTTCKSSDDKGEGMFKHHWSERVPTERYDYDFSTMSYTRVSDMVAFKLTAATQEDCGSSFKEIWREKQRLQWADSVYFPGGGRRAGTVKDTNAVFFDALTLTLRDYDFAQHPDLRLAVIPMQKDTHQTSFEPMMHTVRFVGTSEIAVPFGRIRAHELTLSDTADAVVARYWFAADAAAPILHALVRYEGPQGITYALKSHERTAYWKRD